MRKRAANALLVDSNLLLLYLIGTYDRELIVRFKRTDQYTEEDFDLVASVIRRFPRIIVTPQILAEVSNLSMQLKGDHARAYFAVLIEVVRNSVEKHIDKDLLLDKANLPRFGFTDLSMLEASKQHGYVVLTDDFKAMALLVTHRCRVVNLNHLRGATWSL